MNRDTLSRAIDLKLIVIGNMHTGKTSFVRKWACGNYTNTYKATIVSEYKSKDVYIDSTLYRIQLWDLAGQDRNPSITKIFCKDCHGAVILCEADNEQSWEDSREWLRLIEENILFDDKSPLPYVLVENKIDLIEQGDLEENQRKMKEFCERNGIGKYIPTSAKTGYNINETMDLLIGDIIEKIKGMKKKKEGNDGIMLNGKGKDNGSGYYGGIHKKKCC